MFRYHRLSLSITHLASVIGILEMGQFPRLGTDRGRDGGDNPNPGEWVELCFVCWPVSFFALPQVLAGDLSARMGKAVEDLRFDDCDKLTAGKKNEGVFVFLLALFASFSL